MLYYCTVCHYIFFKPLLPVLFTHLLQVVFVSMVVILVAIVGSYCIVLSCCSGAPVYPSIIWYHRITLWIIDCGRGIFHSLSSTIFESAWYHTGFILLMFLIKYILLVIVLVHLQLDSTWIHCLHPWYSTFLNMNSSSSLIFNLTLFPNSSPLRLRRLEGSSKKNYSQCLTCCARTLVRYGISQVTLSTHHAVCWQPMD